jgi:hypothetical protein
MKHNKLMRMAIQYMTTKTAPREIKRKNLNIKQMKMRGLDKTYTILEYIKFQSLKAKLDSMGCSPDKLKRPTINMFINRGE